MSNELPKKDIQIAAILLEKLEAARSIQSKVNTEYELIAENHRLCKIAKDARTNYLAVLSEVADAVGEKIESDSDVQFVELTKSLDDAKARLDLATKESLRLNELAMKLRDKAPQLWKEAIKEFGHTVLLNGDELESSGNHSLEMQEQEYDSDVEVVDQILDWKSDSVETSPPGMIDDGFDRSSFLNLNILESPHLQHRSEQKPIFVLDSVDIFSNVQRYDLNNEGGPKISRKRFLSDLDFLSGQLDVHIICVLDEHFEPPVKLFNEVVITAVNLKSPDKAAVNRQILRIIEEELLSKKPVVLVSDDLSLTRDAQMLGAIIVDLDVFYKEK